MKVSLITHTPNPEKIIAASARLCYSDSEIDELLNNLDAKKSAELVSRLIKMGHESTIEHVTFTFGIEGVSRSLLAQITRHRMASFSVQSQRYVRGDNFQFVIPPEIESSSRAKQIYLEAMENDIKSYNEITDILIDKHLEDLISQGMDEKKAKPKAEKMAIEDARFVLPNASHTKMIATFNARSLLNFFSLRCCNRAQWEIKSVADEMLKICIAIAPTVFKSAGPGCVRGACPEGTMTCGKISEVRRYYKELTDGD
ncbi:MAG: FAD-dependent thymidylate synthase [Clostridiales bacterium]|nr:FAD-dependent thymidylate synthase [Clostridiales bacterium]